MSTPRIAIIVGTTREGRFSERLAEFVMSQVSARDDLEFDLHPAMDLGLAGIQVRTGKFREARYAAAPRPADRLVADLAEGVREILGGRMSGA